MEKMDMNRHCALCFKDIPAFQVKFHLCPTCGRRSYCSDQCRLKDWDSRKDAQGTGQGHADWCQLSLPEEDLDWAVANIQGKRYAGLKALRLIPTMTRIFVEGRLENEGRWAKPESCKGRLDLVNHSCRPNAKMEYDRDFCTMILYSTRDIRPNEEITMSITYHNESYTKIPYPGRPGRFLESYWRPVLGQLGINCPMDCVCRDQRMDDLVKFGRRLYGMVDMIAVAHQEMIKSRQDAAQGLELVRKLLENHAQIGSCWMEKTKILAVGVNIAMKQEATVQIAYQFAIAIWWIDFKILHPENNLVKDADYVIKNFGSIVGFELDRKFPEGREESFKEWGDQAVERLCKYVAVELKMGLDADMLMNNSVKVKKKDA